MRVNAPLPGAARARGMTLIELMIGIAVAAILFLLAAPAYQEFIANTNVRSAAENTLHGLRTAQAEAVRRNSYTKFTLSAGGWSVDALEFGTWTPTAIATYKYAEGASKAAVDSLDGRQVICFTGLGRIDPDPAGDRGCEEANRLTDIQFSTTMISDPHKLHVVVGGNSGLKLCDTKFAATDPTGCPEGITNR